MYTGVQECHQYIFESPTTEVLLLLLYVVLSGYCSVAFSWNHEMWILKIEFNESQGFRPYVEWLFDLAPLLQLCITSVLLIMYSICVFLISSRLAEFGNNHKMRSTRWGVDPRYTENNNNNRTTSKKIRHGNTPIFKLYISSNNIWNFIFSSGMPVAPVCVLGLFLVCCCCCCRGSQINLTYIIIMCVVTSPGSCHSGVEEYHSPGKINTSKSKVVHP